MPDFVTQINIAAKTFTADLEVLKKRQADLMKKVKQTIYDAKLAEVTKNLNT